MKGFDMSQFEDCEGEEMIDPVEHLESLNDKQKEFLKLAVKNHEEYEALRRKYRDELDALNKKYEELQKPIFEERRQIVAGEKSLEEAKLEAEKMAQEGRLPDFWYHVLRNNDMVREMSRLSDRDKDCMKHIRDIVCETLPPKDDVIEVEDCDCDDECCCEGEGEHKEGEKRKVPVQRRGFKITFHFDDGNEYFPERTLSKTYHLIQHPLEPEPVFDSVESFVLFHTIILWKKKEEEGRRNGEWMAYDWKHQKLPSFV